MTVAGVDAKLAQSATLQGGVGEISVIDWHQTHSNNGMIFTAGRRLSDESVWIRISEMAFPNWCQNSAVVAAAPQRHPGPAMSRWQVPVDDEHSIAFGWRHFNDEVDPAHNGREQDCGVDKIDFLIGQTQHRTYDEKQRVPGDYEAIVRQGPMAIHNIEYPGRSDVGVYMCRALLHDAVAGKTPPDPVRAKANATSRDEILPSYCSDTKLSIRRRGNHPQGGAPVFAVMKECDELPLDQRRQHILRRLDEIEANL